MNQTNLSETINNVLQAPLSNSLKTSSPPTSILLWTSSNNTFILKKGGKKYLGLPRKDKKGGNYWKFKEISDRPVRDAVAKFKQRQEKHYGKSDTEPSTNS